MHLCASVLKWIHEILYHLKTQEICPRQYVKSHSLMEFLPDPLKTPEMCAKAVHEDPYLLCFVLDPLKNPEMCVEAVLCP